MAETRVNSALSPTIWDDKFSTEFYQANPLSMYMGPGRNNPIVVKEDFKSKQGNGITFEFITALERGTIFDRQPLRGHEDVLGEYGDRIFWRMRKKGISMHELDQDLAAIDLRGAAKENLKEWSDNDVKHEGIDALVAVGANCDKRMEDSSSADRNAWVAANSDRVLFGAGRSNYSATFATAIANVDNTADKFTLGATSMLKRMALTASPRITPIRVESKSNRRFFVALAHPWAFRDFKASGDATHAQVSVVERNEAIFLGGDREWDGVVVHELDDMPVFPAGAFGNTVPVAPVILMGQEAVGMAVKERYKSREQKDDYGQVEGLGMIGKWGMKKLCFSADFNANNGSQVTANFGKQKGVVTGWFAAVGD